MTSLFVQRARTPKPAMATPWSSGRTRPDRIWSSSSSIRLAFMAPSGLPITEGVRGESG